MSNIEADALLERIVVWARADANVLALVMTGSRERGDGSVDEFSDFDLEIIAETPEALARDDAWLQSFGRVWVYLPTTIAPRRETRLAFYEGGYKVDFSLCGIERVQAMAGDGALDDLYERGYRVLVDKAGLTVGLPAPSRTFPAKQLPGQHEFSATVEEFWFEAAHIPRYLLRDDLWVAKFRDWTMKSLLLKMLEWHAVARRRQPVDVWHIGVHMKAWIDEETWNELHRVFSRFDTRASWRDLLATTTLFRRLAKEAASMLGLEYPASADASITGYLAGFASRIDGGGSNGDADGR
jgi:aminoglycoside 6-adenylyltransferase